MNGTTHVLAAGELAPECIARLREDGLLVDEQAAWSEAELVAGVDGYDALVAGPGVPVTAAVLAAGHALRVVGRAGVDVAGIDVAEATRRGVIVVHAPDAGLVSEAEHALALVLACARDLAAADAQLRSGSASPPRLPGAGIEVRGKTLGLAGVAASSGMLAERARALGMTVLACGVDEAVAAAAGLDAVEPARVYAQADVLVVVAAAGAPALGAAELAALNGGAHVVSLSSGAVDHAALAHALDDGRVAAAAVTVEPGAVAASPLAAAPHVLFTSAAEASTADARRRAGDSVAEQVAAALRGRLLPGAVNVPAAGDDADELMPYMDLCSRLGRLLVQLAGEPVESVEITYGGSVAYFDTRLLTTGVLGGVLAERAETPVNFVNAEGIAAELGVRAVETRESGIPDFPRLITVAVGGSGGTMSVSGTSLGSEHKQRLVRVFGEDVDIEPAAHMAFLRYVDAPGIGGKVGTLLGEWGVNIGHLSVGRGKLGDEAVMALTLDESLSDGQTAALVDRCGLEYARAVEL